MTLTCRVGWFLNVSHIFWYLGCLGPAASGAGSSQATIFLVLIDTSCDEIKTKTQFDLFVGKTLISKLLTQVANKRTHTSTEQEVTIIPSFSGWVP